MESKKEVDVIIVSYAKSENLKKITLECINSLIASEKSNSITFNIIIIESQRSIAPYQYPYSKTIYPDIDFGYNSYLNLGIEISCAPFICICNNDLVFHKNWASEILKVFQSFPDVYSASPFCTNHHPDMGFQKNDGLKLGYRVRYEIAGWCIMFKRKMLKITGKLDDNYIFWCADNDYANTLGILNINHVLVTSSLVDHLESRTLKQMPSKRELELTEGSVSYFEKKWRYRLGQQFVLIE
jgi:GT2 family glycosyltransferase